MKQVLSDTTYDLYVLTTTYQDTGARTLARFAHGPLLKQRVGVRYVSPDEMRGLLTEDMPSLPDVVLEQIVAGEMGAVLQYTSLDEIYSVLGRLQRESALSHPANRLSRATVFMTIARLLQQPLHVSTWGAKLIGPSWAVLLISLLLMLIALGGDG